MYLKTLIFGGVFIMMEFYKYGSNDASFVVGDKPLKGLISIDESNSGKYRVIYTYCKKLSKSDMKKHSMELINE